MKRTLATASLWPARAKHLENCPLLQARILARGRRIPTEGSDAATDHGKGGSDATSRHSMKGSKLSPRIVHLGAPHPKRGFHRIAIDCIMGFSLEAECKCWRHHALDAGPYAPGGLARWHQQKKVAARRCHLGPTGRPPRQNSLAGRTDESALRTCASGRHGSSGRSHPSSPAGCSRWHRRSRSPKAAWSPARSRSTQTARCPCRA